MCVEWLNSVREKLSVCSDVSGDCSAIQSRLCRIQVNEDAFLLLVDMILAWLEDIQTGDYGINCLQRSLYVIAV